MIGLEDKEAQSSIEFRDVKTRKWRKVTLCAVALGLIALGNYVLPKTSPTNLFKSKSTPIGEQLCPLYPKTEFESGKANYTHVILEDPQFRVDSARKLGKAIQVDTYVEDTGNDFSKFAKFHEYLETEFATVFEAAEVFKVNSWGLVFEFAGTNSSLKPLLLMAHQDTVPPGDPTRWNRDPFSGDYDGDKVYGRGSNDCKNLLVGLLESLEILLKEGFKPERTLLLSFGFDEESNGNNGARENAKFILERYGENSIDHIIDEGFSAYVEMSGGHFGLVATAEKGQMDVIVELTTTGGHSSVPPDHTAIGMLSSFIANYEDEQYEAILPNVNPMLRTLQCVAKYGDISDSLRSDILKAHVDAGANKRVLASVKADRMNRYNVQTSQAVDIIHGGDKANSLPQNVTVLVNHRVAIGNDMSTVWDKVERHALHVAHRFNLSLVVNNRTLIGPEHTVGAISVTSRSNLNVAPITPVDDEIWETLSGHLRGFYEDIVYPEKFDEDTPFVVSPGMVTGNTDTRHYWALTDHIFRMQPGFSSIESGIHNFNEYVDMDSHLQVVGFYYNYITSVCGQ